LGSGSAVIPKVVTKLTLKKQSSQGGWSMKKWRMEATVVRFGGRPVCIGPVEELSAWLFDRFGIDCGSAEGREASGAQCGRKACGGRGICRHARTRAGQWAAGGSGL
jgi:hypothetical protein